MLTPHHNDSGEIEQHEACANTKSPTHCVSVLIPAHNEEKYISNCIASVVRTNWPREHLEILVIDHSSTDSTTALARSAGADVLHISSGNVGAVRNAGLAAAKGEFVAYVDGDCSVPPTWLQTAIDLLESDASIGAVGGPCLSPASGTWIERSLAPTATGPTSVTRVKAIATSSFIARASLLRELGKFDESLTSGEDDDMSNRIRARGLAVVSASDCHIVHHGYPKTWWNVFKKEIWHGSHHLEVRTEFDLTLILTFVFLLASLALPFLFLGVLLAIEPKTLYVLFVGLLLQLAPPFLFAAKRIRQCPRDWRMAIPLLAVGYAYFAGHGVGVLTGLWRHANTRRQVRTRSAGTDDRPGENNPKTPGNSGL